jgi:hypothetical protein
MAHTYRYQVHIKQTNQTDTSRTTNLNGDSVRHTRKGVRVLRNNKTDGAAFVPWENVAYINDLGPIDKVLA